MSFWSIVFAVITGILILKFIGLVIAGLAKYAERKLADKQMEEIHSLADFIVKNSKNTENAK